MAVYVISDIHGNYDLFMELLKKIKFSEKDTLYVLGDVVDRGPHPIKVLHKLMEMPNAFCLVGNHELMAIRCLEFLMQEITEDSIEHMNEGMIQGISEWQMNGSSTTMQEFRTLNREEQEDVLDFMKDFSVCEELQVAGKKYFLVHAGLGNYSPEKDIDDYTLKEMLWDRADYDTQYFPDTIHQHSILQEIRTPDIFTGKTTILRLTAVHVFREEDSQQSVWIAGRNFMFPLIWTVSRSS